MKRETRARHVGQQQNERARQGNVEGGDSGNGSEFEGQCRKRIYLRIHWKISQVKTLKVIFRFRVWVFGVHYHVDNKPCNAENTLREAVEFHGENNGAPISISCIFLHYASLILKYICNSN